MSGAQDMMKAARRFVVPGCLAAVALSACSGPDDASADASAVDGGVARSLDAPCLHCTPTCPSPEEAPLRLPDGGTSCTRVGAVSSPTAGDWPDPQGARDPVVYVGPATGPRTPSGEAPLADLGAALARTPLPATILVGRGTYDLPASLRIAFPVAIRGAGSEQTTIVAPAGADAIVVTAATSGSTEVSLRDLAVQFGTDGDAGAVGVGVRVTGATAVLNLRNVLVARAAEGVRAEAGATVFADGLTVRASTRIGIMLADGSHGYLRGVLVRDGASSGVVVTRSHVVMDTALVADNGRDGIVMNGTVSGAPCASTECVSTDAGMGFLHEQTCSASLDLPAGSRPSDGGAATPAIAPESRCRSVSVLARVAVIRNRVTGLRAGRAPPTADEEADFVRRSRLLAAPGPNVRALHVVVAGTRALEGAVGGYGVYVGPTSSVAFDPDIADEESQGLGSAIVDNAGAGVLADGDPNGPDGGFVIGDAAIPQALTRAGTLSLSGALVASNRGPGTLVQNRAVAERVSFSVFSDNVFMGLGVSSGSLALGLCDQFIGTRRGSFFSATVGERAAELGDGVSLADVTARPETWRPMIRTMFADSVFSGNSRYGFLLSAAEATVQTTRLGNRGSGNQYGVGLYNGARLVGDVAGIQGRAPAPGGLVGSASDYINRAGSP